jgi:hypothetical protein
LSRTLASSELVTGRWRQRHDEADLVASDIDEGLKLLKDLVWVWPNYDMSTSNVFLLPTMKTPTPATSSSSGSRCCER